MTPPMLLVWNELGRLDDGRPEHRDPTDPAVSGVLARTLVRCVQPRHRPALRGRQEPVARSGQKARTLTTIHGYRPQFADILSARQVCASSMLCLQTRGKPPHWSFASHARGRWFET